MELVFFIADCYERINIEKKAHGKSASATATRSLVSVGASSTSKTEYPLEVSLMILASGLDGRIGSKTMRSLSPRTSNFIPGVRPRRRRRLAFKTICPLDERVAVIVRWSYTGGRFSREKMGKSKRRRTPQLWLKSKISTSIPTTLSAFCAKAINLGKIAIKQDFIPPNVQNRSLQVFNADRAFH